jgi:hypothetical protein
MWRPKLGLFIVDWNKRATLDKVFDKNRALFHYQAKGRGTATSEILDMLGIGSPEKAVIFIVDEAARLDAVFDEVTRTLRLRTPGAGIGFTSPLSAMSMLALDAFKAREGAQLTGKMEETMDGTEKTDEKPLEKLTIVYDLIVAVLNQGFSDEFMAKAREAGAGGGTVIPARAAMRKGPMKFLGISVQDEKEIIIILSTRAKRDAIMSACSRSHGAATKAEGIIFSVPVDSVSGVDLR